MASLVRMDATGHSTLAEWSAADSAAYERAAAAFMAELENGYIGVVTTGPGDARQVGELPREADMVLLRRPIAGG